jgi:alpha-glucosidase (family GH31 glycosyl hydrolase)
VFTRSGYLNSPSYTNSLWAGDQNMNFGRHNGLKSCLVAILSSGLVGYSNTHCDIGGYVYIPSLNIAVRTEDHLIRWMQLASFTGVFRTHEGNKP